VVSVAYYAILNAAQAALAEQGAFAKAHSGTWSLFRERFAPPAPSMPISSGSRARPRKRARKASIRQGRSPPSWPASCGGAERPLAAVEQMLEVPEG